MAVATISNAAGSEGLATGVAAGNTNITATVGTISITTMLTVTNATLTAVAVTPDPVTITAAGGIQKFTATGTFSDTTTLNITTAVMWTSDKPLVVSIDPMTGIATATGAAGETATITATEMASGLYGTAAVTLN
jgi:hypothetical protein